MPSVKSPSKLSTCIGLNQVNVTFSLTPELPLLRVIVTESSPTLNWKVSPREFSISALVGLYES